MPYVTVLVTIVNEKRTKYFQTSLALFAAVFRTKLRSQLPATVLAQTSVATEHLGPGLANCDARYSRSFVLC
jgi:hypothetical protein